MEGLRTGRHCAFLLHAHLVFVTKYRARVLTGEHLAFLEEHMRGTAEQLEVHIVEFNGENNHVHLLVNYPPKLALSDLVRRLKGGSSHATRKQFPELARRFGRKKCLWSASSFTGSVGGAPISILRQYIEQQNRPL